MEEILSRGPRSGITFVEAGALALAYAFINDGGSIMHNIWLGVSVENQEMADKRIPQLLKIPAKVRFLSVEPMLGPVDLAKWFWSMMTDEGKCALDWVICGCESGRKRRPMAENWSRSLKDQCAAAGVNFFMKQMQMAGKVTGDIDQFPEDLRVREFPK